MLITTNFRLASENVLSVAVGAVMIRIMLDIMGAPISKTFIEIKHLLASYGKYERRPGLQKSARKKLFKTLFMLLLKITIFLACILALLIFLQAVRFTKI